MPYSLRVKRLAYEVDPVCWVSYSGAPVERKRRMEARRIASLKTAARFVAVVDRILSRNLKPKAPSMSHTFFRAPPMMINMMMHFHCAVGPFTPERSRTSPAYTKFVKSLLAAGLIERPTKQQRAEYPGWAYKTTEKGDVWVEAICATPLPVPNEPKWVVPTRR